MLINQHFFELLKKTAALVTVLYDKRSVDIEAYKASDVLILPYIELNEAKNKSLFANKSPYQ